MEKTKIETGASVSFTEFFWGTLRAFHAECPFVMLAQLVDALVRPQVLRRSPLPSGGIPFFAELPQYFDADELRNNLEPIERLTVTAITPDLARNKTLVMGLSFDELIGAALINDVFNRMTTHDIYCRPDFEVLPVVTIEREDLFIAEKIMKDAAKRCGGDAYLDTIGRVVSPRDLVNLREIFYPEPSVVPGLSVAEARILEAAVAYGYYDVPRRIDLEGLAKKIPGMTKPTLGQRLRAIENRIVNNTLLRRGGIE